ncbi:MAG: T9SS type A sorting domain-containing protein, partial [Ignavibacteriae bacterium]|nr:T9SS type A sorting domain-containing protein [Ignavibacteriota bacterium]
RFENNLTGYACGGRYINSYESLQFLFKTTNAGDNWTKIVSYGGVMTTEYFFDVHVQSNFIYLTRGGTDAMCTVGGLLSSTNSGSNYSYSIYGESVDRICFVNQQTGWVSVEHGCDTPYGERKIYKTTNSGASWVLQYNDASQFMGFYNSNSLMNVRFIDLNTGFTLYRAREKAKFAKTTNGGLNWDSVSFQHQNSQAMFFVNANSGWIGGTSSMDSGLIRRTTNSGQNWQIQKSGNGQINSIFFINDLTGWAVGLNNVILKTVTGGVTDIKVVSDELPVSYSLSQNYPNPFNPSTNIRYDIPVCHSGEGRNLVKLTIFDALGREVETLVNEHQSAGTYEATFDASQYPSGIYFYRLQTESFTETKRMTFVK